MSGKRIFYDEDARKRVLGGAQLLYDAVKTTMGPKGRNVILSKEYGGPTVTHDGVTVAKGVEIEDVDDETLGYSVGAKLIKQAANKMNDAAGDGTTTVTVLTYHILREANKLIAAGHNPMLLKKGLDAAAADITAALKKEAEDITGDKKRVAEVATISAGDKEIGALISDVMAAVGKEGIVTVEEGQSLHLEHEVVEGFTFDKGFVSPYMITDTARIEASFTKPAIIITDKKIDNIQEISGLLEQLAQAGKKDLVLIAEEVEGDALTMLVLNKLKGVFNTVAVKAPSYGDQRKEVLQDIAVLTGGKVISAEQGHSFDAVDASFIGSARKVIVSKDETTIIEGAGTATEVKSRVKEIAAHIDATQSDFKKTELVKRRAALEGKVAVIKVGGASETEIEEKKYRVDDAVAAVKAAMEEGIVAGGGVTLVNLAGKIAESNDESENAGRKLLVHALEQPFRVLLENSGLNADEWLPKVLAAKPGHGVNVAKPTKLVDLKKTGVVDPVAVTRQAVQYASSIAGTGMTMGALVVDIPNKEDTSQSQPNGMGMM